MKIYSYVVARDFGFAPNPFHGYCTLATCKPNIREKASVGDLVIGTRKSPNSTQVVFLMFVTEILTFEQYWNDERFRRKQPTFDSSLKNAFGDNIYHLDEAGQWIQEDSHHTYEDGSLCIDNLRTDTKSNRVLISNDFAYWGSSSIELPEYLRPLVKRGPGHKTLFDAEFKEQVVQWAYQQSRGVFGTPINW
jgi:hypothetical protein